MIIVKAKIDGTVKAKSYNSIKTSGQSTVLTWNVNTNNTSEAVELVKDCVEGVADIYPVRIGTEIYVYSKNMVPSDPMGIDSEPEWGTEHILPTDHPLSANEMRNFVEGVLPDGMTIDDVDWQYREWIKPNGNELDNPDAF